MKLYTCPCCGYITLTSQANHEICKICNWQDDGTDASDPDTVGGANRLSLRNAQKKISTLDKRAMGTYTKDPTRHKLQTPCECKFTGSPTVEKYLLVTLSGYLPLPIIFKSIATQLSFPEHEYLTRESMTNFLKDLSRLTEKNVVIQHTDDFIVDDSVRESYVLMLDTVCTYRRSKNTMVIQPLFPIEQKKSIESILEIN